MNADIITICDQIAERITQLAGGSATVSRRYSVPRELREIVGREVYVFPANYVRESASRSENQTDYEVQVITLERYEDAGEPPTSWMDTRIKWVQDTVADGCDFSREFLEFAGRQAWTQAVATEVYVLEDLHEKKLFHSTVTLTLREIKEV
jgi:hypothetical protein